MYANLFADFLSRIARDDVYTPWLCTLPTQLSVWCAQQSDDFHGLLRRIDALASQTALGTVIVEPQAIRFIPNLKKYNARGWERLLHDLSPWRKGPFFIDDLYIDAEWRSDMKWTRFAEQLPDIQNKRILDVGGGNAWFAWQLAARGADVFVVDPNPQAFLQYQALSRLADVHAISFHPPSYIPLYFDTVSQLPVFDCVFSMGVIYHHRAPFLHLKQLRRSLRQGGLLVLETIYEAGDVDTVHTPKGKYFGMRNVWQVPSLMALQRWLLRSGFSDIRVIHTGKTTQEEQRTTQWLQTDSLSEYWKDGLFPQRAVVFAR